jgi:hypothetical protein
MYQFIGEGLQLERKFRLIRQSKSVDNLTTRKYDISMLTTATCLNG